MDPFQENHLNEYLQLIETMKAIDKKKKALVEQKKWWETRATEMVKASPNKEISLPNGVQYRLRKSDKRGPVTAENLRPGIALFFRTVMKVENKVQAATYALGAAKEALEAIPEPKPIRLQRLWSKARQQQVGLPHKSEKHLTHRSIKLTDKWENRRKQRAEKKAQKAALPAGTGGNDSDSEEDDDDETDDGDSDDKLDEDEDE